MSTTEMITTCRLLCEKIDAAAENLTWPTPIIKSRKCSGSAIKPARNGIAR